MAAAASMTRVMRSRDLYLAAFDNIRDAVHSVLDGLDADDLALRPEGPEAGGNSIAWLVWHLTRIQDDHLADAMGVEQRWTSDGFAVAFALPFDELATGYGQSADEVAAVRVSAELLSRYHDAVHAQTRDLVAGLADDDLDRIVDERWDPPVTLGVRLVSVLTDDLQHVGQAAYVRGLLDR